MRAKPFPGVVVLCLLFVLGEVGRADPYYLSTYQAGTDDLFGGGLDPASPSADLARVITRDYGILGDFDETTFNRQVAHTFGSLPNQIAGGTLEFRVRGNMHPGVWTDMIVLSFADAGTATWPDAVVWQRTFGQYDGSRAFYPVADAGLITPGTAWAQGAPGFVTLDLAALPLAGGGTLDLIPLLNQYSFLDVAVSDDTMVDYYRLNLTVVPLPGAVLLGVFGLGVAGVKLRRGA